jgi:predicted kinase
MGNDTESADPMQPLLVVVTGVQGTGKSTVAEATADLLGTAVLAHDWAMSALRPYPEIQAALDEMEPPGHRVVGWSILESLARAQLRRGCSIVLDGVAREPEIARCQAIADDLDSRLVVIVTQCSDLDVHRSRIDERRRVIPNWYELDWDHVQAALAGWESPEDVDLCLEATDQWEDNLNHLRHLFGLAD